MVPMKRFLRLATMAGFVGLVAPVHAQESSFGADIPIGAAVKQIVPDGYKVVLGDGVDATSKATWNGGGWRQSLTAAARSAGYTAQVSGETVRISKVSHPAPVAAVDPAAKTEKKKVRVSRAEPHHHHVVRHDVRPRSDDNGVEPVVGGGSVSSSGFVLVESDKAPQASVNGAGGSNKGEWRKYSASNASSEPVKSSLVVREGQDLRSALQDWSDRSGWKLVWNAEYEYALISSAKFSGDFQTSTSELLRSMDQVRPRISATFYTGNKTLVVGNAHGDAAGK